jgi:hypothetical protein
MNFILEKRPFAHEKGRFGQYILSQPIPAHTFDHSKKGPLSIKCFLMQFLIKH